LLFQEFKSDDLLIQNSAPFIYYYARWQPDIVIHRANATQVFLGNIVPDFTSAEERAPHSPDLNPLDYSVDPMRHFAKTCV